MVRNISFVLIYTIIALALLGLVAKLFTNPVSLLISLFTILGVGVAIFALLYFLLQKRNTPSDEMKKYRQAVKQSKLKYNKNKPAHRTASKKQQPVLLKRKKRRKHAPHLRVIEGKKTEKKKDDRALF